MGDLLDDGFECDNEKLAPGSKSQRMQRPERLAELCEGPAWDYIQALERQVWHDIVRKRHPQQSIIDRLPTDENDKTVVPGRDLVEVKGKWTPCGDIAFDEGVWVVYFATPDGPNIVPVSECTLVKKSEADDG